MSFYDVTDLVILLVVGLAVAGGVRRGLTSWAISLAGLALGAVVGTRVGVALADRPGSSISTLLLQGGALLVGALVGLAVGRAVGRRVGRGVGRTILRAPDRLLGGVARGAVALVLVWVVAAPVAAFGSPAVARSVEGSGVLRAASAVLPAPSQLLDELGSALHAPSDLASLVPADATAADPSGAAVEQVKDSVRSSVVSIHTVTGAAGGREGTGFVVRRGVVATNAHVIAGSSSVTVSDGAGDHRATVAVVDSAADVALLTVSGLDGEPLTLASGAAPNGTQAVVMGYPGDGPLKTGSAVVLQRLPILSEGQGANVALAQEVYRVRAVVRPGNSGGPLLDLRGRVIGIVSAQSLLVSDQGFALTLSPLRAALARLG